MDIQKEREAFQKFCEENFDFERHEQTYFDEQTQCYENDIGEDTESINMAWSAWQAAKSQADQKIKLLLCDEHLKKCESPTGIFNSQYPDEEPCLICLAKEAKAQAVPEGFVLVKTSDRDQEMLELIDQRDHMEGQAEELKDKLQALYGVNFGEHSSCNFPFQNAIDYDDSDLVLVPREPNEKMIMNGLLVISTEIGKYDIQQEVRMIWEKMIEAQEPAND